MHHYSGEPLTYLLLSCQPTPEAAAVKLRIRTSSLHFVIISASLCVNIASVSADGVDLSLIPSVTRSVGLCVCVSEKCTVAKRLIGPMPFEMVSGIGREVY